MPSYLLQGTDREGRTESKLIDAESAQAAVRRAESEGWSDVRLLTDDVVARLTDWQAGGFAPEELWRMGRQTFRAFVVRTLWRALSRSIVFWALLAALIVRRGMGADWGGWDWALVAGLGVLVLAFLVPLLTGVAREYDRLLWDVAMARWDRVLDRLDRGLATLENHERVHRRAQALAALGRLDEALREFAVLADGDEVPPWLYWSLRANVHAEGRDYAGAISDMQEAYACAPENPTVQLGYAELLLLHDGDRALARHLLDDARRQTIAEPLRWAEAMLEGQLALEERRFDAAREHFAQALVLAGPLLGQPAFLEHRARIQALLALTEAGRGDREQGRRHFQSAVPMLRLHRRDELIQRCERALGGP
jgi:tetratricopeptide (TPR) repeat protein